MFGHKKSGPATFGSTFNAFSPILNIPSSEPQADDPEYPSSYNYNFSAQQFGMPPKADDPEYPSSYDYNAIQALKNIKPSGSGGQIIGPISQSTNTFDPVSMFTGASTSGSDVPEELDEPIEQRQEVEGLSTTHKVLIGAGIASVIAIAIYLRR